ncbi:TPD1 protein homolog 1B-like isoform X2 [Malus sylvestris]|uniref:TPD1 protein homolog 1B-like isoform X2 n=1 Tax=Malus sylvestris TaxID=3752 RepID=UPI0021ABCC6B|nr:TPD1 protein homolog 1B-like isoform X2 [Malus sylvestris]
MASSHLCFAYFFMMLMFRFCILHGAHSASCGDRDISISQGQISATGIPKYAVEIVNTCTDCAPSQIHVHCGQFAAAEVIPPSVFTRIADDDCLVNGGEPLRPHDVISFTYATTFKFPISFKSAQFC